MFLIRNVDISLFVYTMAGIFAKTERLFVLWN